MSQKDNLQQTYLIYYQVYTDGKLVAHGNITSTNQFTPLLSLSDEWREWIAKTNNYSEKDIFIVGVFKL
jgi:hypothetical protein